MNFYFCETCGKRITDRDLAEGQGRDKKLKGVYCKTCSAGVLTLETLPLTDSAARELLNKPAPAGSPPSGARIPAAAPRAPSHARPVAPPSSTIPFLPAVGLGVAAFLGVGLLLWLTSSRPAARLAQPNPPAAAHAAPATPANGERKALVPATTEGTPPAPTLIETPPAPVPPAATPEPEPTGPEKAALVEFENLARFEGLEAADLEGRRARLTEFVNRRGETLAAARARRLLDVLGKPAAVPVAPSVERAPPPVVPAAAVASSARFLRRDDKSHGSWKGVYGGDGYYLAGYQATQVGIREEPGLELFKKPAWMADFLKVAPFCRIMMLDSSARAALQPPTGTTRILAMDVTQAAKSPVVSLSYTIAVADARPRQVALYFAMLAQSVRIQSVTVLGEDGKRELDTHGCDGDFGKGFYMVWEVSGAVTFKVHATAGTNAVCSGLFFDTPAGAAPPPGPPAAYLSDLSETDVKVGFGELGKKGALSTGKRISVAGQEAPHGLYLHPPSNGKAQASYVLGKQYRSFLATVALDDVAIRAQAPQTFRVLGDGKVLWESQPIQDSKKPQECALDVSGVEKLTLEVECAGPFNNAYAVWVEPRLTK